MMILRDRDSSSLLKGLAPQTISLSLCIKCSAKYYAWGVLLSHKVKVHHGSENSSNNKLIWSGLKENT